MRCFSAWREIKPHLSEALEADIFSRAYQQPIRFAPHRARIANMATKVTVCAIVNLFQIQAQASVDALKSTVSMQQEHANSLDALCRKGNVPAVCKAAVRAKKILAAMQASLDKALAD